MLKNPIAADALPWLNVAQQLRDRRGDSPRHGTDKSDPPYGYHGAATSRQPLDRDVKWLQGGGLWPDHARVEIDESRPAYLIRAGLK